MNCFIALTDYHAFVYRSFNDEFDLVDLRRRHGLFYTLFVFFKLFLRLSLCRESHVLLPHVFNPYSCLLFKVAKKVSFYDEGVAYYNNTATPSRLRARLYVKLAGRKISKGYRLGVDGYLDFLKYVDYKHLYLFYPHALNQTLNKAVGIDSVNWVASARSRCKSNKIILFLDSTNEMVDRYNVPSLLAYIERLAEGDVVFLYKSHPSGRSVIGDFLLKNHRVMELEGDLESFMLSNSVDEVYSLYSSASITAKIIDKNIKVFYFKCFESDFGALERLFFNLGVVEVNDYCQ